MPITPGYGETPVSADELADLQPIARELLGSPVDKAAVYDLEQAVQTDVAAEALTAVLSGAIHLDDVVSDIFLRELHSHLYGEIWTWAGVYRTREVNIGVAPEHIATDLRASFDTLRYRWHQTTDWTAREFGVACHAEAVRIHPFTDGNGRATRLLADLVFVAAQNLQLPQTYDWALDKERYIDLLRQYDRHRDPRELAAFIAVRPLAD